MRRQFLSALAFFSAFFFSPLQALPERSGPLYDSLPRGLLDCFAEKLGSPYGLKVLLSGTGETIAKSKHRGLWAIHFVSQQTLTIEEARPMATYMAEELINFIYTNPSFTDYFAQLRYPPNDKKKPALTDMGFRIAFWDENVNRPQRPYVAEIYLADGVLSYFYANPDTQALENPVVEPFAGAERFK